MRFLSLLIAAPKARRLRKICLIVLAVPLIFCGFVTAQVVSCRRLICASQADAPVRPVAIVFGAVGSILTDRVLTGVELYKAGKVRTLLMTGDNSRDDYNEPDEMRSIALSQGVPSKDIVCDFAGFRTYDSLYRARDIFGVRSAILVTQGYHLPRALFIARKLGLDVVGVDAAKRRYVGQGAFNLRELGAIQVAWWQAVVTHPRPKYLGKVEAQLSENEGDNAPG